MKVGSIIEMLDSENYDKRDLHKYQYLIGELMYLLFRKKPNIIFIIDELSRYNTNKQKSRLQVVKGIVRYLKKTIQMGLILG